MAAPGAGRRIGVWAMEQYEEAEPFLDRRDAGRRLARRLGALEGEAPVVVALPRGGVPVAAEIAAALDAPLDLLIVRKLGMPGNPEYGIGALVEDGTCVLDSEAISVLGLRNSELDPILAREKQETARRVRAYRGSHPPLDLAGRVVIVVDDGVATGLTDTAALRALRRRKPARLILAVPVCSPEARERLVAEADEVLCLRVPRRLRSVGQHYLDFGQVPDREVTDALGPRADAAA
jgi:putative phosphoribosyl transferase